MSDIATETIRTPRPVAEAADAAAEPGPPDRRRTVVAVAALAVAGLAGAGVLLLGGGSDELDEATTVSAGPVGSVAAAPDVPVPTPPVVAEDARPSRDPFQVLYAPPAPAGAGTTGTGTTGIGTTGAGPTGTGGAPAPGSPGAPASVPTTTVPGAAPPAPVGAAPAPASRRLLLKTVSGSAASRTAVFALDDEQLTVGVGDAFGAAGDLLLLSLQQGPADGQWTAVVQVGQGEPFDVVTGSPVTFD